MEPPDRRATPREPLLTPASVELEGDAGTLEGRVLNASQGGLWVIVYAAGAEVGMTVRVSIPEDAERGRPAFSSEAEVVRIETVLMAGADGEAQNAYDIGLELAEPLLL